MNKKQRRHDGWISSASTIKAKRSSIIAECLEPHEFWDDWEDYRDGLRGYDDRTRIRPEHSMFSDYFQVKRWNKKLKRMLKIRKARKSVRPN
jgi:hypothetical protein